MIQVQIESLANGGDGVAHLSDGRVVFVPRGFPGDEVVIELKRSQKKWARGEIKEVIVPSPARQQPGCAHFDVCGGCAFQHIDYNAEFESKADAAAQAFARIARCEVPDGERHQASESAGYRVRARLHSDGERVGYVRSGSHDVFELTACPVLDPVLSAVLPEVRDAVRGHKGEISIETAGGNDLVAVLRGDFDRAAARRLLKIPTMRGVRIDPGGAVVGNATVSASVAVGLASMVLVPAGRFRQSNARMTPVLRDVVARRLGGGPNLVEYFAGSGSFTFSLRDHYDQITAYELDPMAVDIGKQIVSAFKLDKVRFAEADLEENPPSIPADAHVLLDPPRTGALKLATSIGAAESPRVVYVSCDVGTLARDARVLLEGGYALESLDLVDMFPRTPHIEAVATFTRG